MKHLEISQVSQSFDQHSVLNEINITVEEGEFVSLLGPSGSGKSTLFQIIGGILKPQSGEVCLEGQNIIGRPGSISYMPQSPSLLPWRNVLDNVLLGQEIVGKKDPSMALKMIDRAGLSSYEYAYPHVLSGGMKQRVSFIRSILSPQSLILLDEPFSALDEFTRLDMQKWLLSMWEEHRRSILFITHNIDEAIFLSDRIIMFSPRPASVIKEVKINFSRPREESLLLSDEFLKIKKDIYRVIRSSQG